MDECKPLVSGAGETDGEKEEGEKDAAAGELVGEAEASAGFHLAGIHRVCGEHRYTMRWITWRALVHYVVDDVASSGKLCGGLRGEHRHTMETWWMAWGAPVHCVVDDVASTGTLCGG